MVFRLKVRVKSGEMNGDLNWLYYWVGKRDRVVCLDVVFARLVACESGLVIGFFCFCFCFVRWIVMWLRG